MTLVESWGRSVEHDDSQNDVSRSDVSRRVTRRAALQIGAGTGVAAIAAPYVARFSRGEARAVDLSDARPAFAAVRDWPVPPIVTRTQWGANEALRTAGQLYDAPVAKTHRPPHGNAERHHRLRRALPRHPRERDVGRIHRHRVQLADRSRRAASTKVGGRRTTRPAPRTPASATGANVRGAHAIYNNSHTIGIALMGTYDNIDPSPAMLNSLVSCSRGSARAGGSIRTRAARIPRRMASSRTSSTSAATATPRRRIVPARRSSRCCPRSGPSVASAPDRRGLLDRVEPRPGAAVRRRAERVDLRIPPHEPDRRYRRSSERRGLLVVRGRRQRLRVR